ncbi:hypothetical protein D8674_019317 [Pyrus ussuriensis x Pyrus communis]|uniref:DUF4283 domain-containing protein n=1 Tax=Pyrus ussuriensis x Pyrus communis TaxID=2448454 RepID=A0A5N5G785_9ROSA|nr:hypothetical protein D8674_019317 [Pyrus ussuriensis x Pyrus communis]
MARDEEMMDCLSFIVEDSLDMEERFKDNIHLVGHLTADNESSKHMVKEMLWNTWNKMGVVKVLRARPNVFTITNARAMGQRIGAVLEVEDLLVTGFQGFTRLRVDFDACKPLVTYFQIPCQNFGSRMIRLNHYNADLCNLMLLEPLPCTIKRSNPVSGADECHWKRK